MVRGRPSKAAAKKKQSLALARQVYLEIRKSSVSSSTSTPTPDTKDAETEGIDNESSGEEIECTGWSGGVTHYISSDEDLISISDDSEEEEDVEELSGSELEEVIQRNREKLKGAAGMGEDERAGGVMEGQLAMLKAAQPKAESDALSIVMGRRTNQEWRKAESTRSLGYNGQSSRTRRRYEKASRDKETENANLRKG